MSADNSALKDFGTFLLEILILIGISLIPQTLSMLPAPYNLMAVAFCAGVICTLCVIVLKLEGPEIGWPVARSSLAAISAGVILSLGSLSSTHFAGLIAVLLAWPMVEGSIFSSRGLEGEKSDKNLIRAIGMEKLLRIPMEHVLTVVVSVGAVIGDMLWVDSGAGWSWGLLFLVGGCGASVLAALCLYLVAFEMTPPRHIKSG